MLSTRQPYDYASVMHYGRTAFGNGRETITPLQSGVSIGNRNGMTDTDKAELNAVYGWVLFAFLQTEVTDFYFE